MLDGLYIVAGVVFLILLLGLWLWMGPGPRRSRRLNAARKILRVGDWQEALSLANPLHQQSLSSRWERKINGFLAECHRAAARHFTKEKQFEEALESYRRAAALLNQEVGPSRALVVESMLEEVRWRFAASKGADTQAVQDIISRTLIVQSPCPEASFWQALCCVREKDVERAVTELTRIMEGTAGVSEWATPPVDGALERFIDPPLYLGALLLERGDAREALLYLTEANRVDGNCPVVICQLGRAMVAAGGDAQFAVRALQRALGPRGLAVWADTPSRVWSEGLPPGKSYVQRLAVKHLYECPLWGKDLSLLQRQANTALAEGYYRLGQHEQAAALYGKLVHESAPSEAVLRGLGLTLVKLGRYDEAFKHLRAAHELEQPKTHLTAGYLALCGAKGKPSSPEDKTNNVAWALWLVRGFESPGDREWVELLKLIHAEAHACGMSIDLSDQQHLCEHLVSVQATDPLAAECYDHLATTFPAAVKQEHAWYYCRASQLHDLRHRSTLDLFARVFNDLEKSEAFWAGQDWNFEELEYVYLERAAELQPGRFPEVLGPEYPLLGGKKLLERAGRLQEEGKDDQALDAIEVLVRLSPQNVAAHDRLAELHYRRGNLERAIEVLQQWHEFDTASPTPLVRLAVLHQRQGDLEAAVGAIRQALEKTSGPRKAKIAFLGARLVLAHSLQFVSEAQTESNGEMASPQWDQCVSLLEECLGADPEHVAALWILAAIRCLRGDREGLASLQASMNRTEVNDSRFHYFAALCSLAAGDQENVEHTCRVAGQDPALAPECDYVRGWAAIDRQDVTSASEHFAKVVRQPGSPSADYAHGLLGGMEFFQGSYEEAAQQWKALDGSRRARWKLEQPLAGTVLLSGLQAFERGDYQLAAAKIRDAGRLGFRDRRLGLLLSLALLKAGQKLLYKETE